MLKHKARSALLWSGGLAVSVWWAGLVSGVVAITMAWAGYGIWVLLWMLHAWRPARVFCMESVLRLFAFGGYLMIAALMDVFH